MEERRLLWHLEVTLPSTVLRRWLLQQGVQGPSFHTAPPAVFWQEGNTQAVSALGPRETLAGGDNVRAHLSWRRENTHD